MRRWIAAVAFAVAVHVGVASYLLAGFRQESDGDTDGAINVELVPDVSEQSAKPDDVAGPKMAEAAAPTSDQAKADDPDPPAPDSAAPTETEHKPDAPPDVTAPPSPATADAVLPPPEKEKPPEPEPPKTKPDETKDKVEHETAPSRASNGSTAQLEGGRRPSAEAKATWAGAIGTHLAHLRRYPREARAEGWQGVARVRVTVDENGHVMNRELVKSSGRPVLDEEALALMERSDPFPKPPAGMPAPIALTVPVKFALR